MLNLTRKARQSIYIKTSDGLIRVKIHAAKGHKCNLGIDAPQDVKVWREEIMDEWVRKNPSDHGR